VSQRHRVPEQSEAGREATAVLRRLAAGAVEDSPLTRWLYSTDASSYRVVPEAVLMAASTDDLIAAAVVAGECRLPLTVRGAGTSLAGQAIGAGLVVDCFKLDRILAVDPDRRTARVEPGVIQAQLNLATAPYALEFGPDTSTVEQATIGGMVGNNSSGSRSIIYGETRDKTLRLATVLVGGDDLVLGPSQAGSPGGGLKGSGARRLAPILEGLRDRLADVAPHYPPTDRYTFGYDLRVLLGPAPNPARLLAGSEGSLALFTELEVLLDERPALRLGAAFSFTTVRRALEANLALLATAPSAVELIDLGPLRRSPNLAVYSLFAPLVSGDEEAMLTVEYQGEPDEVYAGLARLRSIERELGAERALALDDPARLAEAAALRRAVLPLLMGAPGVERPAAFVEDTAVPPDRLADFVEEFSALVAARGARASFSGHVSAGCLHIRPLLDLKSAAGVASMAALARDVAALVRSSHGAFSGEHGAGRSRSWALPELAGPALYGAMAELKRGFDPQGLLAPGIIVDGPPVVEGLRFGADYRGIHAWRPRLSFAPEGGFDAAVERCFGAGICKKLTGTMCPTAAPGRDELLSTRARANALQGVLCGAIPLESIATAQFESVLGTCLACKACKTECPAGVDLAALKVEWLAEVRARRGVPPFARAVGGFRRLATLVRPVAPLVNAAAASSVASSRVARAVAALLGVAPQRRAPRFAIRTLTRRVANGTRRRSVSRAGGGGVEPARAAVPTGSPAVPAGGSAPVAVFADCFIEHQEPEIGEALVRLLAAAGRSVGVLDAGCCGRTALSTGQIERARRHAAACLDALHPVVREGAIVAVVEPSCLSMILDDWVRLLPGDERLAEVRAGTVAALALVADAAPALAFRPGGRALLHPHCHERALCTPATTMRALGAVEGLELEVLDAGCCGMSGVFGYERDHYELSVAVAERALLPAIRAVGPETAVLATGTSCRAQIADLAGRTALHPLVFLADRLER
jgi:FAD/FMN-containing dehydrogenase/Fe-S oxidoreductase